MASFNIALPIPSQEIIIYQRTIESLGNNTLMVDYFNVLKKILEEGYSLTILGFKDDATHINDVQHLKNYINHITGIRYIQ